MQDFPLSPAGQTSADSDTYDQLTRVLRSLNVPSGHPGLRQLGRYDLRQSPRLVASIATRFPLRGWDEIGKVGLGRLGSMARDILGGSVKDGGVQLEAQGSSMSKYGLKWLRQFHILCSGLGVRSAKALPLPDSAAAAQRQYEALVGCRGELPVKIFFPTKDYVQSGTMCGIEGGGCHFGKVSIGICLLGNGKTAHDDLPLSPCSAGQDRLDVPC